MENLVKNQLMNKPIVKPMEPVEVFFRPSLKKPVVDNSDPDFQEEEEDYQPVTFQDKRRQNKDYNLEELQTRLRDARLFKVKEQRKPEERKSQAPVLSLPPSDKPPVKRAKKLSMKKLVLVEDDDDEDEEDTDVIAPDMDEDEEVRDTRGRITPKIERGVAELDPADWKVLPGTSLKERLPVKQPPVKFRLSSYYMDNRKIFVNFINSFFQQYRSELEQSEKELTCDSLKETETFSLLTHQKLVRDYMNLYTPYRGLLLYHGLGSGKSCSSIAIAEGMKSKRRVIVMTPKSLLENYKEELKKCGDFMYKKKQYWEWVHDPEAFETLSYILQLPIEYIQRRKGAWLMDVSKPPNNLSTSDMKSLDDQINEMIYTKYTFIPYNGLREKKLEALTDGYRSNLFDNSVVVIDEAHNFISRIVNKISKEKPQEENNKGEKPMPKSFALKLYELLLRAKNARIVLLSGTPIINYPNEIGILFNILRGYIKTWEIPVVATSKRKISTETLQKALLGEKVLDYLQYSPSSKKVLITRNPFGFKNKIKEKTGYHGVTNQKRNQQGESEFDDVYISDQAFESKVLEMLKKQGLEVNDKLIKIHNYKALPDTLDKFVTKFIDPNTQHLTDAGVFKKRIIGLTSYYRSPSEGLMPRYEKNPDYYHVVKIPMSNYQFKVYETARATERKNEKNSKKKKGTFDKDGIYQEPTSTYRIFSRLFCNFVMPPHPGRPMPRDDKKLIMGEDDKTGKSQEEVLQKASEHARDADFTEVREGEIEADEAIQEVADSTYAERIQKAIEEIRKNSAEYLTKSGLEKFSPKFLTILENLKEDEYVGLHLIYTQFRALEGVQLLSMVLEANGFARFKLRKTSNSGWEIDIDEKDKGKPTFALYTGTESDEEKKLILKIYNGFWDDIPVNIANQLRKVSRNNNLGEIIKVFMITSSGSEGINLRNTRYVHVVEPYWHPVRTEQVIGRARRICSHKDLDITLQSVEVFIYLMTFSQEQLDSDESRELKKDTGKRDDSLPLTSDEFLYEISSIKEEINTQLTIAIKEAAIDCNVFTANSKEGLDCLSFGEPSNTSFAYNPDINKDEDDVISSLNTEAFTWKADPITIYGIKYAARKVKEKEYYIYDLHSYLMASEKKKGNPIQVGTLRIMPNGKKVFNTLVT